MQTLEQLKQEQAAEDAKEQLVQSEDNTEVLEDETESDVAELDAVEDEVEVETTGEQEESEAEAEAKPETELWMQEEEQTSSDDDHAFTSSDMKGLRLKNKAKLEEKDSEIEQLRNEVEKLKTGTQPVTTQSVARPKLEEFDYDEDKYNEALDNYYLNKLSQQNQQTQQQAQQTAQQQATAKAQEESLNGHYEQVKELVQSKVITKDSYANAETVVRNAMDKIAPGHGDALTDDLIANLASLGDGSAKVLFHLGKNKTNLSRVTSALASNNAFGAMAILGELKGKLTAKPAKKISSAPTPSGTIKGDETVGSTASKLQRRYKQAMKGGDSQKAFDARREAKAAGLDVNSWS